MFNRTRIWIGLLGCVCTGLVLALIAQGQPKLTKMKMEVTPLPMVEYVLASPRGCLLGRSLPYPTAAAVENFARADGKLVVRAPARVNFCLSHELEGVWYPHSYGRLGTSLLLQMASTTTDAITAECQWVTLGRDGASDVRLGPSIGHATVGVQHVFRRPGLYVVRGKIRSVAQPLLRLTIESMEEVEPMDVVDEMVVEAIPLYDVKPIPVPAVDQDMVYVWVRVVDGIVPVPELLKEVTPDPDEENDLPMRQGYDEVYEEQLDNVLYNLEDLAAIAEESN